MRQVRNKAQEEQDQEHEKENPGHFSGGESHHAEAQKSGNQCDEQENQCVIQHFKSFLVPRNDVSKLRTIFGNRDFSVILNGRLSFCPCKNYAVLWPFLRAVRAMPDDELFLFAFCQSKFVIR